MSTTQQLRRSQYRVLGLVGHGQFGRVYCAVHRKTGEMYALKDLNRDRFPTHKFLRELRFLLSLEHSHIAACHALEQSATGRQLVLDYCEGNTLRYLLESEIPLPLEEILDLVIDLLAGLEQAHQESIVHCDIKPENLLLTIRPGGWQVKISDFGVARLRLETSHGQIGNTGSPAYMAPERFYNQHSAASDLYAVGIILYELLMGKRPFTGTPTELMVAHLNHWPTLPEALPLPLQEVIQRSLQKLLAKRYKTAAAMGADLRNIRERVRSGEIRFTPVQETPPVPLTTVAALPAVTLPHPVTVLGVMNLPPGLPRSEAVGMTGKLVVTCDQTQAWFYYWRSQRQDVVGPSQGFSLKAPVVQIITLPQGGCFITHHSIHVLAMQHGLATITRCDHRIMATVSPDGCWYALCNVDKPTPDSKLILRRLITEPGRAIATASITRVPLQELTGKITALQAIDQRHLLIATVTGNRTQLHCFTRRGTSVGTLNLGTAVHNLTPTTVPYRYMALEAGYPHSLIVLDLKPFRVYRYRLDIPITWIFNTAAGYAAISQDGQLRLVSNGGYVIARVEGLPAPQTIMPLSANEFLLVTNRDRSSRAYTVELNQLGLDILF